MKAIVKNTLLVKKISRGSVRETYRVGRGATLTLVYVVSADSDMEVSPFVHLIGEGALVTIIGLVSGSKDAKVTIHTLQHHKSPMTTSNLLIKSVLRDSSQCFYEGSILVDRAAQKTDAYQRNENLLLGKEAHATSSPILEILANDVRCTHGAVVKTLDENELWYLKSRGIDSPNARDMIAKGFLASALTLVQNEQQRKEVARKVAL